MKNMLISLISDAAVVGKAAMRAASYYRLQKQNTGIPRLLPHTTSSEEIAAYWTPHIINNKICFFDASRRSVRDLFFMLTHSHAF